MKKVILIILFCEIMILNLTGCGTNNKLGIGDKSNIKLSNEDISLTIKDGTLKNTGATLILKNNSNKNLQYGNPYEIEIKENGKWHKVNVDLYFNLPVFYLNSGETKEIELNWEYGYGKLEKGTYRIIKVIDYEYEEGKFQSINVAVEFDIK